MSYKIVKFSLLLAGFFFSCSESQFSGQGGQKNNPLPQTPPLNAQNVSPTCDMSRDFVSIENLPGNIQSCEDSGGFYFYLDQRCIPITEPKAQCTFTQIKQLLTSYNIPTRTIDDAMQNQAKIIDCRHIPSKKTVAINWWFTKGHLQECQFNSNLQLVSGCYRVLPEGSSPIAQASTPDEHASIARQCFDAI